VPTPVIAVSGATLLDAIIVVAMVVVEVFLLTQIIPRRGPPTPLARMVIGSSALLGSAGVLMALLQAFLNANLDSYTTVLFAFNFTMLAPPGLWMIAVIIYRDRTIDPTSWLWPAAIVAMATLAEILMGLLFVVSDGAALDVPTVLAATLTSAWYLWSMVAAMVTLLVWVPLPRLVQRPLLGLSAAGFVAPWVVADPVVGALLMAAVMAATILLFYRVARRPGAARPREFGLLTGIFEGFVAMSIAGVAVAATDGALAAVLAFGVVTSGVMVAEFLYLVRRGLHPAFAIAASDAHPTAPIASGGPREALVVETAEATPGPL
jgi:hypothetical protein